MIRKSLFTALLLLGLTGVLIHYKAHPFFVTDKLTGIASFSGTKFIASLLCLVDVFVVTILFTSRKTAVYGYLINGMIVILGTILMTHFSIASFAAKGVPPGGMLLNSTAYDIAIAWADFFVGRALYEVIIQENPTVSRGI